MTLQLTLNCRWGAGKAQRSPCTCLLRTLCCLAFYMLPESSGSQETFHSVTPYSKDAFEGWLKGSHRCPLSLTRQRCYRLGMLPVMHKAKGPLPLSLDPDNGSGKHLAQGQLALVAACSPPLPGPPHGNTTKGSLPFSSLMIGFISCSSLTELETKTNVTATQKS